MNKQIKDTVPHLFGINKLTIIAGMVLAMAVDFMPTPASADTTREKAWQTFLIDHQKFIQKKSNMKRDEQVRISVWEKYRNFIDKAAEFYRQDATDNVAFHAMVFLLSSREGYSARESICRNLRAYHLRQPKLNLALSTPFPLTAFPRECEQLFNAAITSGVNQRVRDTARASLAVIYREMTVFLANISELQITAKEYLSSTVREDFSRVPEEFIKQITRQLSNSNWLNRRWQTVRSRAIELSQLAMESSQPLVYARYSADGYREIDRGTIGDWAKTAYFQLEHATPGGVVTNVDARDMSGAKADFEQYRGKVVVLSIWASWNQPCVKNIPKMRELQKSMKERPFQLITLSVDQKPEVIKDFTRRHPMPFVNWHIGEDEKFLSTWPAWPIPKLFVIDQHGVVRSIPRVGYKDLTKYLHRMVADAERTAGI